MSEGAGIRSIVKVISGTFLVVGLGLGFVERWFTPYAIVTEGSTILPPWMGWLGWGLMAAAAVAYFIVDIYEWRERHS